MGALAVLEPALAIAAAAPFAFAGTVTYSVTSPTVPIGTQVTVQLPQFDRALRELLRAAGCSLVRQGKDLAQPDHAAEFRRTGRHPEPPHRERHSASSGTAEGILASVTRGTPLTRLCPPYG